MLILVFSDSHGRTETMITEASLRRPDLLIHLGDCLSDARAVSQAVGDLPVESVPGNCDFSYDEPVRIIPCGGIKLLITHGHLHRVKSSLDPLRAAARAAGVRAALFGHTHIPHNEDTAGLLLFNPGSISLPLYGSPSYGILEIDGERLSAREVTVG